MKAITVQQPWAWAIFHGKNIENRTQAWTYRGPLAIHAGNRWSDRGQRSPLVQNAFRKAAPEYRTREFRLAHLNGHLPGGAVGAILGVVDLVDVHPEAGCCAPWGEASYVEHGGSERRNVVHLILENPRLLDHSIPCRGALGLWTPPADVIQAVNSA